MCYDLASESIERIGLRFGATIAATGDFWFACGDALYAKLTKLNVLAEIDTVSCDKRDRFGGVVLPSRQMTFAFV